MRLFWLWLPRKMLQWLTQHFVTVYVCKCLYKNIIIDEIVESAQILTGSDRLKAACRLQVYTNW